MGAREWEGEWGLRFLLFVICTCAVLELYASENRHDWCCVLAGQETVIRFSGPNVEENVTARWSIRKGHRLISQGTVQSKRLADDNQAEFSVRLAAPPTDTGSVLDLEVELHFESAGKPATLKKKLYVYPAMPFDGETEHWNQTGLQLFDPDGDTQDLLDSWSVPHTMLRDLGSIDNVAKGVVIVGENIQLARHPRLLQTLANAVARGVNVLVLAPAKGSLVFEPDAALRCTRLHCERESVIARYDSRFDCDWWLGEPSTTQRFQIQQTDSLLKIECTVENDAWPWIELQFDNPARRPSNARMFLCGFGIAARVENGPMPRRLLYKVLHELSPR